MSARHPYRSPRRPISPVIEDTAEPIRPDAYYQDITLGVRVARVTIQREAQLPGWRIAVDQEPSECVRFDIAVAVQLAMLPGKPVHPLAGMLEVSGPVILPEHFV